MRRSSSAKRRRRRCAIYRRWNSELQGAKSAVSAGLDARPHQPRPERHHQALLGDRGYLYATDRHRFDLRHELRGMPELDWQWGYPLAITLMVFAAIGPYVFFRWKKWL